MSYTSHLTPHTSAASGPLPLTRVLATFALLILLGVSAPAQSGGGGQAPHSKYATPAQPNFQYHEVAIVDAACWEKLDLGGTGFQEEYGSPYVYSPSWDDAGGKLGTVSEGFGGGFDIVAYTEVFDSTFSQEASASVVPLGEHVEQWNYCGQETGDVEEAVTVKLSGEAESVSGLSRATVAGLMSYSSNTAGLHVASISASFAANSAVSGQGSFSVDLGICLGGVCTGMGAGWTVTWYSTTGHGKQVDSDIELVLKFTDSEVFLYTTENKLRNDSWADGGHNGIGASRARADAGGYIAGVVTLGEHS